MALTWLANAVTPIAIDTSTVINLNATGCAAAIIRSLPVRLVALDVVVGELEAGRIYGRNDAHQLNVLVANGLVEIVQLGASGERNFEELTIGPAFSTLDDGEAATIAYAQEHDLAALVDEKKATRICAERFPSLPVGCTVDLLVHPVLETVIGKDALAEALFNALIHGRMRVVPHHIDWVVALIGPERSAKCHSLPRAVRLKG